MAELAYAGFATRTPTGVHSPVGKGRSSALIERSSAAGEGDPNRNEKPSSECITGTGLPSASSDTALKERFSFPRTRRAGPASTPAVAEYARTSARARSDGRVTAKNEG